MTKRGMMVLVILLVVFIFFSFNVHASDESLETFSDDIKGIVLPPGPPEEKSAQLSTLKLTLKDYNTKSIIGDTHANLVIINKKTGKKLNILRYVPSNGIIEIFIEPSQYTITFTIDIIHTQGYDYFFESDFSMIEDYKKDVYLLPIGSVIGTVYDNKGNVIRNAKVNFKSNKGYCNVEEINTDNFGLFNVNLPVGSCKISAMYGNYVGYATVEIEHGKLAETEIELNKNISSSNLIFYVITFFIVFILAAYFISSGKLKRKNLKNKEIKKDDSQRSIVEEPRIKDIINTLNDKESLVVNFLLEHENKSTQSKLKYEVNIPKTTLSRLLEKLEAKNIIKIERIGKVKKIELTDWFLGKK